MKQNFVIGLILLFSILFSLSINKEYFDEEPIIIKGGIENLRLKTFNGCGIGNFLIPCVGNGDNGQLPILGCLNNDSDLGFKTLDTIPGTSIKGIAFKRLDLFENTSIIEFGSLETPYIVISDIGIFKYLIPSDFSPFQENIERTESIYIPNIVKVADKTTTEGNDPIVLLIADSLNYKISYYSYPAVTEQLSFSFEYFPTIFEVIRDELFVVSKDSNQINQLFHFSSFENENYNTYELNDLASNPQEIIRIEDDIYILSSPGDSMVIMSKVNLINNQISQSVIYEESGARATYNAFKEDDFFTFQPTFHDGNMELEKQIMILNPIDSEVNTLTINTELDYFKHPSEVDQSFGLFSMKWIGAKWSMNGTDSLFLNQDLNDNIIIKTEAYPQFINASYGCWLDVGECELEQINFEYYPNPASSKVTLNLSGLIKDRAYDLSIFDSNGNEMYSTKLKPYQKMDLPIQHYSKGIYFIKLKTANNIITKKLIVE